MNVAHDPVVSTEHVGVVPAISLACSDQLGRPCPTENAPLCNANHVCHVEMWKLALGYDRRKQCDVSTPRQLSLVPAITCELGRVPLTAALTACGAQRPCRCRCQTDMRLELRRRWLAVWECLIVGSSDAFLPRSRSRRLVILSTLCCRSIAAAPSLRISQCSRC